MRPDRIRTDQMHTAVGSTLRTSITGDILWRRFEQNVNDRGLGINRTSMTVMLLRLPAGGSGAGLVPCVVQRELPVLASKSKSSPYRPQSIAIGAAGVPRPRRSLGGTGRGRTLSEVPVLGGLEGVADGSDEWSPFTGPLGEDLLGLQDSAPTNTRPSSVTCRSASSTSARPERPGRRPPGEAGRRPQTSARGPAWAGPRVLPGPTEDLRRPGHAADAGCG